MEKKTKSNKWKTIAIIFIILFVLETLAIGYIYYIGDEAIQNKETCSNQICYFMKADTFYYDDSSGICQCYNGYEIIYEQQMK